MLETSWRCTILCFLFTNGTFYLVCFLVPLQTTWWYPRELFLSYRVFSLTWPASMQIYWNKRKRLHKKRVQLPQDWFGTPTWPPFHCFGTPIWPPWRHVKTLYNVHMYTCMKLHVYDLWKDRRQILWRTSDGLNCENKTYKLRPCLHGVGDPGLVG